MSARAGRVRWLGHSTVLLEMDGARLLTDPVLRPWVLHLRRAAPLVAEDRSTSTRCSSPISTTTTSTCPPCSGSTAASPSWCRGARRPRPGPGFRSVEELEAGGSIRVGPALVRAVHAEHDSSRALGAKSDALGYFVEGSRRVYFPGDTDLFPEMASLAPGLDLALVPIWGWGPSLGPGHLDPRRAAEALTLLRPRLAVPIHWGTYYPVQSTRWKTPAFLSEPVREFERCAAELAPEVEVRVLQVGEELTF